MFVRFTLLVIVAAAAAVPATDRSLPPPMATVYDDDFAAPWFNFPSISSFFAPIFKLFPSFTNIGPKVTTDDNKFQIVMNGLKDYNIDDLKVKTKGKFTFIQGSHEVQQDDHDLIASQFFHTFRQPDNCNSNNVTAILYSDGNLVVRCLLSATAENAKDEDRDIPVIKKDVPYVDEEEKQTDDETTVIPASSPAPVTTAPDEDEKEPTTPEDGTEKDNVIPYGNEINP